MRFLTFLIAGLYLLFSVSVQAYMLVDDKQESSIPSQDFRSHKTISYGWLDIDFTDRRVKHIELDHPQQIEDKTISPFIGVAEAKSVPTDDVIEDYFKSRKKLLNAAYLKEIKEVISEEAFNKLQRRVNEGANQTVMLEMLRLMMPENVEVYDVTVKGNSAQLAVRTTGQKEPLFGVVDLKLHNGYWTVMKETWYDTVNKDHKNAVPLAKIETVNPLHLSSVISQKEEWEDFRYYLDENVLNLRQPGVRFPKDSVTLMFFIEKKELKSHTKSQENIDEDEESRPIHVVWRGPRVLVPEQKMYEADYPMDFSIAHEKEGYMSDNFNLILPRRKPKQVNAAFLYQF